MYETCKMTRVKKGALDQPSNILPTKETTIQLNYIQLVHIQIPCSFNEKEIKMFYIILDEETIILTGVL